MVLIQGCLRPEIVKSPVVGHQGGWDSRRGNEKWRKKDSFRMEGFGVLFFALGKSPVSSRAKCCRAKDWLSSLYASMGTGNMGPCSPAMGGSALSPLWRLQEAPFGALWLWMSFWRFWISSGILPCIWGWSRCLCAGARVAPCPVGVVSTPLDREPAGDGGWRLGMPSS